MEIKYFLSKKILSLGRAFGIVSCSENDDSIQINKILVFFVELEGARETLVESKQTIYKKADNIVSSISSNSSLLEDALKSLDHMVYCELVDGHYDNYITDYDTSFEEITNSKKSFYLKKSKSSLIHLFKYGRNANIKDTIRKSYKR